MDGFDHYSANEGLDFVKKWGGAADGGAREFISGAGRFGGQCFESYGVGTAIYTSLKKTLSNMDRTVIIGAAFKFSGVYASTTAYNGPFKIDNGNSSVYPQMCLHITAGGIPIAYRKTGGISYTSMFSGEALGINTWYYLEMMARIHPTLGKCEVRIDGESIGTYEGDTQQDSPTLTTRVMIGVSRSTSHHWYFDDVYIASGEDFLGDVRIDVMYPNASGEVTELTAVGAPENFQCVSGELFPPSGEYVQASYGTDTYKFEDCGVSGEIFGLQVNHISSRTEPVGTLKSKNILRKGSTNYSGEQNTETDSPTYKTACFDEDPTDSNTWTPAKVDASEFGVEFE